MGSVGKCDRLLYRIFFTPIGILLGTFGCSSRRIVVGKGNGSFAQGGIRHVCGLSIEHRFEINCGINFDILLYNSSVLTLAKMGSKYVSVTIKERRT